MNNIFLPYHSPEIGHGVCPWAWNIISLKKCHIRLKSNKIDRLCHVMLHWKMFYISVSLFVAQTWSWETRLIPWRDTLDLIDLSLIKNFKENMVLLSLIFKTWFSLLSEIKVENKKKRYLELQYMQCLHLHPAMSRNILRKYNSITL